MKSSVPFTVYTKEEEEKYIASANIKTEIATAPPKKKGPKKSKSPKGKGTSPLPAPPVSLAPGPNELILGIVSFFENYDNI